MRYRQPLRKIVDLRVERIDGVEIEWHVLECEHEVLVRYNSGGRPVSGFTRRNCWRCGEWK